MNETEKKLSNIMCRLIDCLDEQVKNGIENLDTEEAFKCADIIKDLAETMYHEQISIAMDESRYGKAYSMDMDTYKKKTASELRDMDRKERGLMYYTETDSKYENAKRTYAEVKATHNNNTQEDNTANIKSIEEMVHVVTEDIMAIVPGMTPTEKTYIKQKLLNISNEIK